MTPILRVSRHQASHCCHCTAVARYAEPPVVDIDQQYTRIRAAPVHIYIPYRTLSCCVRLISASTVRSWSSRVPEYGCLCRASLHTIAPGWYNSPIYVYIIMMLA